MPSHGRIFRAFSTLILWNSHFGFSCCSTREDLYVDVSIINVGLVLTKLRWFQIFATSQNSNFWTLKKKNQINRFLWCSTHEALSIDVSITNVGLILTKLRWFQLFVTSQNSNFELFWKKNQINRFPWCSTREDLSIDVQLLMYDWYWRSLGDFSSSSKSKFDFFWKKIKFLGFHGVVLVKTFPLMYQLLM